MNDFPSSSHLILMTSLLVVVTGIITVFSLKPPSQSQPQPQHLTSRGRGPASTIGLVTLPSKEPFLNQEDMTQVLDISCLNHEATIFKTQAKQIRLMGHLCDLQRSTPHSRLEEPQIINQTNGFLATVFLPQNTLFTSDFIDLTYGKNQILISWKTPSGKQIHKEVSLFRNPTHPQ